MSGQPLCVVVWKADPTETPIKMHVNGLDYTIAPNTETEVPVNVMEVCVQSSFDVQLVCVVHPDGEIAVGDDAKSAAIAHHDIKPVVVVEPEQELAAPPPPAPAKAKPSPKAKA